VATGSSEVNNEQRGCQLIQETFQLRTPVRPLFSIAATVAQLLEAGKLDESPPAPAQALTVRTPGSPASVAALEGPQRGAYGRREGRGEGNVEKGADRSPLRAEPSAPNPLPDASRAPNRPPPAPVSTRPWWRCAPARPSLTK